MADDFIIPKEGLQPKKGNEYVIKPVPQLLQGQAKNILIGAGLPLIKSRFIVIDQKRANDEQSTNDPGSGVYNYDKKNVFGLPLFDTLTFNGLTYENFEGQTIELGDFTLDLVLIQVSNTRNIIRTPIMGRNGTIKEYMSDGDYEIKLNGQLINPLMNIPPETMIRSLNQFCKVQTEIAVNSTLLSYLDIASIVIAESRFFQRQGARNVIDYELMCYSETPFELKQNA